jgi:hypothetical protein
MARTRIARALARLAAEHRTADALGTDVETLRQTPPDDVRAALTRRGLLAGAGAVVGVAAAGELPSTGRAARAASAPGSRSSVPASPGCPRRCGSRTRE